MAPIRTSPFRVTLGLLTLVLALHAGSARADDEDDSPPAAGQVRVEGRIESLAPDHRSLVLAVVFKTSPSGKRTRLSPPVLQTIRLRQGAFIVERNDLSVFHTPEELKPGGTVLLDGAEDRATGEIASNELRLGGQLPRNLFGQVPVPTRRTPVEPLRLAKYEPKTGCYLGAFVMRDENIGSSMERWVQTVGKGHASYLRYVGYGQPFPADWVASVRGVGASPNIAFEPNRGLAEVQDNAYLHSWAKAAGASGGPVFLRFASEMNGTWTAYSGDPRLYRDKFRLVARVMREEAPNVAMVWTPYCMPENNIPDYYPGDDAVDWVGVNIYSVHHHDGRVERPSANEDPAELLRPIYQRYAARKPIQISEYAATHYCQACNSAMPQFAVKKMTAMYASLPARFPRVKMIYWFSWDTIAGKAANNDYAVTSDPEVLRTYQSLIRPDYFLSRITDAITPGQPAAAQAVQ